MLHCYNLFRHEFDWKWLERNRERACPVWSKKTFHFCQIFWWFWLNKIFKRNHKEYVKKLEEVESLKKSYSSLFEKYKKKLNSLESNIQKYFLNNILKHYLYLKPIGKFVIMKDSKKQAQIRVYLSWKPRLMKIMNTWAKYPTHYRSRTGKQDLLIPTFDYNFNYFVFSHYLKIILGSICVSILNKEEK